jgi:hypothetical protein
MCASRSWWILNGLLLLGVGGLLTVRSRTLSSLQREHDALVRETAGLAALHAEHGRLAAEAPSAEELGALREERRAAEHLRRELAELRERIQRRLDAARAPLAAHRATQAAEDANLASARGPESWRNVGRETPSAAIETTLWAAAGGDVPTLAEGLLLGPGGRSQARAVLERLPPSLRSEITTPEHLVALLMAGNPPQEKMQVSGQGEESSEEKGARRTVTLARPGGEPRRATLVAVKVDQRWKLVVPDPAVASYLKAVTGPLPAPKPR